MSNLFVEVPVDFLPYLRDAYKIDWPEHIIAFCFLDKMIRRFKECPEQREFMKIYCIDGKIEEDATFIAVMVGKAIAIYLLISEDLTFFLS